MASPYPQLRELGNPQGVNIWAGAPQTPGATGNNPMAVAPHAAPVTPKWQNALMSMGQGIANAVMAPGNALMGNYNRVEIGPDGSVSPVDPRMMNDASTLAGLVTLGAGAAPAEAGALRAGASLSKAAGEQPLAMDLASRMERARDAGFYTKMPVYHGTDQAFEAFDPTRGGSTTGAAPARTGAAWVALDPETADEFAALAAKAHGGSPQVYPLFHRASNPARVDLDGTETNLEIAGALQDAFANGHDAVMFRNYTTPGGLTGRKVIVVRDPQQLRSVFAAFNAGKIGSSDLLAALAGAGAIGVGTSAINPLVQPAAQQPAPPNPLLGQIGT